MIRWNWRGGTSRIPLARIEIRHTLTLDDVAAALSARLVVEWEPPEALPALMGRTAITATVRDCLLQRGENYCTDGWADECFGDQPDIARAWAFQQVATAWPEHAEHVTWGRREFESGILATYGADLADIAAGK